MSTRAKGYAEGYNDSSWLRSNQLVETHQGQLRASESLFL